MLTQSYDTTYLDQCYWTNEPILKESLLWKVHDEVSLNLGGEVDEAKLYEHLSSLEPFDLVQQYIRTRRFGGLLSQNYFSPTYWADVAF